MLKPVANKLAAAWKRMRDYDPERDYLNSARDLIDLERRQREIDRGKFRHGGYGY